MINLDFFLFLVFKGSKHCIAIGNALLTGMLPEKFRPVKGCLMNK